MALMASCGGSKTLSEPKAKPLAMNTLIMAHEAASPNFTTMAGRIQVAYDDGSKSQSVTVSLRMKKDEVIWIKASILGITIAKALITPEKVQYYETISNTYFDGDFTLISDWLGASMDFNKAQAILLGQSIFPLDQSDYKVSITRNRYKVQPKRQPDNFIHSLFLSPVNFKVESGSLSQPKDDRLLSIKYGPYRTVDGNEFPSDIQIDATEGDEKTQISVTYKNIDLNAPVRFPFDIPSGFEPIQLSE